MAKVSAGDIRNGVTIEVDGKVCQVIDFMHVKPGKGAAFVRVKMKNIIDGGVVETTFRPTETFEQAHIERKKMQYLYNDGEFYNYMDNETFEQIMISAEDAADSMKFVKENIGGCWLTEDGERLLTVLDAWYESGGYTEI